MSHTTESTASSASTPQSIDPLLVEALQELLATHCTPSVVRAVEQGDARVAKTLWQAIEGAGFADAMVPEALGGAGLTLAQSFALFELCGRHVLPLPLAETTVARAWAVQHQMPSPIGPVALHWIEEAAKTLPATAQSMVKLDTRLLCAALTAAQMAGAMQRVLEMTLHFASEREQFGKPLGKFQAIQHQLAVMAEQVFAARMAAQIGCSQAAGGPAADRSALEPEALRAAIAKARASEAAVEVAAMAHSIHGAIGFTEAFDLQLFTRRLHAWRQLAGSESFWHKRIGEAMMQAHGPTLDLLQAATDVA